MQKIKVPIKGMHCRSCEMMIEKNLADIKGIAKTEISHKAKGAIIYYENEKPDMDRIETAIREAGYEIGHDKEKGLISKNLNDYKDLGMAMAAVIVGYFLLKGLGVTNINVVSPNGSRSLSVVLLVGLTAGISTCMAMVGGLVLGMAAKHAEKHPEATRMENFRPHLFFNLGRVAGFSVLGGILGLLGSTIEITPTFNGAMVIVVAIIMFVLGLQLMDIFPWANNFSFTIPKGVARLFGIQGHEKEYSHGKAVVFGALTFFLPCGFTQAMQAYALSSGNFFMGAAIMGTFAIGTMPGLLGIGGATSVVKGIFAKRFFKFAGIVIILLSLFNLNNGLNLLGYEIDWSSAKSAGTDLSDNQNNKLDNGMQVINMTEDGDGYSPNRFTVRVGVPVKWVIDAQAPNSCASALVVPKLQIRKFLQAGENVIEFTPKEIGRIPFSCSMGMYTGSFDVIN